MKKKDRKIKDLEKECCLNCGDEIGGNYTGLYRYSQSEEGKMCDVCALHFDI